MCHVDKKLVICSCEITELRTGDQMAIKGNVIRKIESIVLCLGVRNVTHHFTIPYYSLERYKHITRGSGWAIGTTPGLNFFLLISKLS